MGKCPRVASACAAGVVVAGRGRVSADPYEVLGVAKDASRRTSEGLSRACQEAASRPQPRQQGDGGEVQGGVGRLRSRSATPRSARRFDNGEIDASGAERPPQRLSIAICRQGAADPMRAMPALPISPGRRHPGGDLSRRGGRGNLRMRGADTHYRLRAGFPRCRQWRQAAGDLPDGSVLDVTIPPAPAMGRPSPARQGRAGPQRRRRPATRWSRSPCGRTARSPARTTTSISSCRSRCAKPCSAARSTCRPRRGR